MLEFAQFFLGNRMARKFIFFYMIALHLLVTTTIYHYVHNFHRAPRCPPQRPGF